MEYDECGELKSVDRNGFDVKFHLSWLLEVGTLIE